MSRLSDAHIGAGNDASLLSLQAELTYNVWQGLHENPDDHALWYPGEKEAEWP